MYLKILIPLEERYYILYKRIKMKIKQNNLRGNKANAEIYKYNKIHKYKFLEKKEFYHFHFSVQRILTLSPTYIIIFFFKFYSSINMEKINLDSPKISFFENKQLFEKRNGILRFTETFRIHLIFFFQIPFLALKELNLYSETVFKLLNNI